MLIQDRRRCRPQTTQDFRAMLNTAQLVQLSQLEREGWTLRFVRQQPPRPPVPVLSMRDDLHAVLHPDGRLEVSSTLDFRT